MGKINSNAVPFVLDYPSEHVRTLAIAPGASQFDVSTLLEAKLSQLEALLSVAYGISGDSFRSLNDDIQDRYLWAAASMAQEAKALYQALGCDHLEGWSAEEQKAD